MKFYSISPFRYFDVNFSLQIQMPLVLQNQLIYSVYLTSPAPAQGQMGWPKIGPSHTSIVDPHGVVEIASSSLNVMAVEGSKVWYMLLSVILFKYYETIVIMKPKQTNNIKHINEIY